MNPLCPFCNAALPPLSMAPTADKLPCPRCGELVPAVRWTVDPAAQSVHAGEPPVSRSAPMNPGAANRKTAFMILGIMLTMAVIACGYALWTADLRRSRHPYVAKEIGRRRPLELTGLGYLPKDIALVAGLHVAEIWDDQAVGRKLLDEPRPALLDWALKQVTRTTGLDMKDLDHVLAAVVSAEPLPQVVLVVKTRAPYDLERIARTARPAATPLYKDRALYEFSLNPLGSAYLWCVEDRTLIYVLRLDELKPEHLSGLSAKERAVDEVLPASLRGMIKERLARHHHLWVAGRVDQLDALKTWLPINQGAFQEMKAFAIGIEPVEGLTLTGHFQVHDVKASARFKAFLEGVTMEGAKSQKVEATPNDVAEQWITWQVRGDTTVMRDMLGRGRKK